MLVLDVMLLIGFLGSVLLQGINLLRVVLLLVLLIFLVLLVLLVLFVIVPCVSHPRPPHRSGHV